MLVNIAKDLKLFYVNQLGPSGHAREDPVHGASGILDMAFIAPGLSSRDISFSVADDHMGSDRFPIQISLDKPLRRSTPLTEPRCRFGEAGDGLLHSALGGSLSGMDASMAARGGLGGLAVALCGRVVGAVGASAPGVYSRSGPRSPIGQAILGLVGGAWAWAAVQ